MLFPRIPLKRTVLAASSTYIHSGHSIFMNLETTFEGYNPLFVYIIPKNQEVFSFSRKYQ